MVKGRGKEPTDVGDIIETLKKTTSLGRNLEEAQIWERWPELAGPMLMARGRPVSVRDGVLTIEVENAVWMHKFSYYKWDLVQRINDLARHELVSEVFFVLAEDEPPSDPQHGV